MLYDANGGVSTIQYNLLNLPDKIYFTAGHRNQYTYDAVGQKLRTVNYTVHNVVDVPLGTTTDLPTSPSDYTTLTTDYIGNMIYENGALNEVLLPEGYYQNGTFYYYLKDHLGDNRVTINSSGSVVEKSHYYPSGTRFFTESTNNNLNPLPYRYSGKEMEGMNGLNQMDYGARRRFSWAPIWTAVDPMAEDYPNVSSYVYCHNNPINMIDPDGMTDYEVDSKGYITERTSFWKNITNSIFGDHSKQDFLYVKGTKNNIEVEKGALAKKTEGEATKELPNGYTSFEIHDNKNAKEVFQFIAVNSQQAEWSWTNLEKENMHDNVIGTSHEKATEGYSSNMLSKWIGDGYTGKSIHSHAFKKDEWNEVLPQVPSGYGKEWNETKSDRKFFDNLTKNKFDLFEFSTRDKQYYQFNATGFKKISLKIKNK